MAVNLEDRQYLLIADDNLDGLKFAVASNGECFILDTTEECIEENLNMTFS